LLCI
jgi:dsDNA-specific endonuclease/ATPase MutS2